MDWIRRNWPDLLIGVALVAVIAMIVATLLSGGSLPSLLRRNTPPELPITRTTGQTNPPANGANGGANATANAPATANTPSAASAGTDTEANTTDTQDGDLDVFVPGTSAGTDADTAEGTEAEAEGDTEAGTVGAAIEQPDAAPAASNTAANAGVNTPLPQSVPNGGFRVAAGAVDSRESALTAAQTFRDADYTVTVEQQDDLYLLWIGPYASDAGAERVAARLQEDGLVPDALVYTYDPDENAAASEDAASTEAAASGNAASAGANAPTNNAAPANTPAQTAANGAGTPASADTSLSAPAGQRFLQVGAFRSDESAQPQLEQLESLGLTVTSDEDDEGIVRLYVGPFTGAQLAQTQTRLSNQGIDSFPVTP